VGPASTLLAGRSLTVEAQDPEKESALIDYLKKFPKAPILPPEEVDFRPDEAEMLSIERRIRRPKRIVVAGS